MFFYCDTTSGHLDFVIIHDRWEDGDGGSCDMYFDNLPSSAVVDVEDDDATEFGLSHYPQGHWGWAPCCTDGGALGLPNSRFRFEIITNRWSGINWFLFMGGNDVSSLNFYDLSQASADTIIVGHSRGEFVAYPETLDFGLMDSGVLDSLPVVFVNSGADSMFTVPTFPDSAFFGLDSRFWIHAGETLMTYIYFQPDSVGDYSGWLYLQPEVPCIEDSIFLTGSSCVESMEVVQNMPELGCLPSGEIDPNPFTFIATIVNRGTCQFYGGELRLVYPPECAELRRGNNPAPLTEIAPSDSVDVIWQLWLTEECVGDTACFSTILIPRE